MCARSRTRRQKNVLFRAIATGHTHVFNKFQKGYCKQVNQAGPMCPPKGLPVSEQCILNALSLPALSSHSQLSENNIAVTRPAWAVVYCFLGSRWLQSGDKVNSYQTENWKLSRVLFSFLINLRKWHRCPFQRRVAWFRGSKKGSWQLKACSGKRWARTVHCPFLTTLEASWK